MVAALADVKVNAPVYVLVKFVNGSERLPAMLMAVVPARVIVASSPEMVKSRQAALAPIVTVNAAVPVLLFASKITSSEAVGADAPVVADDIVRLDTVPEALIV
jgi:hypothetical protein